MSLTHRTATAALAVLLVIPIGTGDRLDADTLIDAEDARLVAWAFERFDAAGLDLPDDASVVFHDSTTPCEGNQGTVRPDRGNEAWVCVVHDDPATEHETKEHIVLHELAHVWADAELGATERDEFMTFRGADNWNDRNEDWWNRGTEQAAEVITWGLLDREPGFQRINDRACPTMMEGYRILTATDPINAAVDC